MIVIVSSWVETSKDLNVIFLFFNVRGRSWPRVTKQWKQKSSLLLPVPWKKKRVSRKSRTNVLKPPYKTKWSQVIWSWKHSGRHGVPEITRERNEWLWVQINSCSRVGKSKSCAGRLHEDGRVAVSKINRAVSMKIRIEDSKRYNIPSKRERLKIDSQRRGVDETKSFWFYPI